MQLSWLEKLTKNGHVTTEERDKVYASCLNLAKTAAPLTPEQAALARKLNNIILPLWMTAAPVVFSQFLASRQANRQYKAELSNFDKALTEAKEHLVSHPDFANHKDKVEARFIEIAKLAPAVARNKPLMERILKEKLHSGLTHEDVTNLAMIQASHVPSMRMFDDLSKKTAAESAGRITANVYNLFKAAGLVPDLNDMTKQASFGNVMKNTLMHALAGTAAAGLLSVGAGAVNVINDRYSRAKREKELENVFSKVMDRNHPGTDKLVSEPEKAREAFKALATFAPSVALNPYSARSFLNAIVGADASDVGALMPTQIKDLTDIERNISSNKGHSPFMKGFIGGVQTTGFGDALGRSVGAVTGPLAAKLETEIAKDLDMEPTQSKYKPREVTYSSGGRAV